MPGSPKYLKQLGTQSEMPHIGQLLQSYIEQHRTYQSALARVLGRAPETLRQYKKNHSLQAAIVWELSHALKYNFFADLAAALPADFGKATPSALEEKEAEIAELRKEVAMLERDKELLMQMQKRE